jgi:hypothetical protein
MPVTNSTPSGPPPPIVLPPAPAASNVVATSYHTLVLMSFLTCKKSLVKGKKEEHYNCPSIFSMVRSFLKGTVA